MKRLATLFITVLLAAVAAMPLSAQSRTVSGKVSDGSGEAVVGAYILLEGSSNGTMTDAEGNYSIQISKADAVLTVSCIGFRSESVTLAPGQLRADVILELDSVLLEDAVVIGYGVQNRRDLTTSIASIKAEDFANKPTADFRESMAAKMPGVQVLTLGGQPEGNVSIRVRGIQSATSGNEPLYVIDGVPCDDRAFANIDASDIESLEVLKDASAAAIYGSRGSCGVILVTTKKGSSDKPRISYDGMFSVASVAKTIDMLDAY